MITSASPDVLRPGGYWILSGPPINWEKYYQTWERSKQDAKEDQNRIENIAGMLCWDKIYEKEDIAISSITTDICK